jgi:hypothetical protein
MPDWAIYWLIYLTFCVIFMPGWRRVIRQSENKLNMLENELDQLKEKIKELEGKTEHLENQINE